MSGGRRIVIDWGTSSFRATLVDADDTVLDRHVAPRGIRGIERGAFERAMREEVGSWLGGTLPPDVIAAGMVGSRNGWLEVPYVPTPAGLDDLARGVRRMALDGGTSVALLPGVVYRRDDGPPDVMRGEETQVMGLCPEAGPVVILPGTHSKWVRVEAGRIIALQSFVTGELFDLLADRSFVGGALSREGGGSDDGFDMGVAAGISEATEDGGLLSRLFGTRSRTLFGQLAPEAVTGFLSGLLIGSEFREASLAGWFGAGDALTVIGSRALSDRYVRAAEAAGAVPALADPDVGLRGALAIAARAGEIGP